MQRSTFDYSEDGGLAAISDEGRNFRLVFSRASDVSIYVYTRDHNPRSNIRRLTRLGDFKAGKTIPRPTADAPAKQVTVLKLQERFLAESDDGVLQGRIVLIKDSTRRDDVDQVVIEWDTHGPTGKIVAFGDTPAS